MSNEQLETTSCFKCNQVQRLLQISTRNIHKSQKKSREGVYPINCETSSGGYFVWENVRSLLDRKISFTRKRENKQLPFQTLDVFPTDFVVQDMCNLVRRNFLTSRTFVDSTQTNELRTNDRLGKQHTQPWSLQWARVHFQWKDGDRSH